MSEDSLFKLVVSGIFLCVLTVLWLCLFPWLPWSRPAAPRRADYVFVGSSVESPEMFDAWIRGDQVCASDSPTSQGLVLSGRSPADVSGDWWAATDAWEMMTDSERARYFSVDGPL